jgi:predicted ester cyclase
VTEDAVAGRRKAARRAIEEIWTGANPGAIEELYAPHFVGRSNLSGIVVHGRDEVRRYTQDFSDAIGNLRFEILDQVSDGDRVSTRWTGDGERLAVVLAQLGLDTGPVRIGGITTQRFEGELIAESWTYWDASSTPPPLRLVDNLS